MKLHKKTYEEKHLQQTKEDKKLTHVITEPCIGTKDASCVEVCPVDCIHEGKDQYYIDPEECIDCMQCVSVCPVEAIFAEEDVPEGMESYTEKNANFFLKAES